MKKVISLLLVAMMVLSLCPSVLAARVDENRNVKISATCSKDVSQLAAQHLRSMQEQLGADCVAIGFQPDVFMNMTAMTPFTVYTFDENGKIVSNDTYMSLLIYSSRVVGTIGIGYDESGNYCYSLGTNYAEEMNTLLHSTDLTVNEGIVVGRFGDKLFATDGIRVKILLETPMNLQGKASCEKVQISDICGEAKKNAGESFCEIVAIDDAAAVKNETYKAEEQQPTRLAKDPPNPMPIPHIEQTGVCGAAAWAAVLNYRLKTNYDNDSLETAMHNGGYANGTGGNPKMTDYRDYANDVHDAGCVHISSPPSFSKLTKAIDAGRPIMGCWGSGSGSDKSYHAVVITGYIKNSANNYTYYVKNPWHPNATTITVTSSSSVVYPDANYTWTLLDSVY